ncbi:PucR family transcriptional regulator [Streptomyces sp. NRRL F-5126]|uniref:PucR family transcriptional regulator n=1 Tax=Streptomyces sp. NRRL F-5126 TaxID=1463857 RepID=UPI00068C9698|nr:PucR family transcriptional regulator [Streptomyces sp. NRRL F-5126]
MDAPPPEEPRASAASGESPDAIPSLALRSLVDDPALGLTSVTSQALLTRRVSWAHVSELPDPGPYLLGGELLLTAGLALPADPGSYVDELVTAGVAALGLGLAPVHRSVPRALAAACEERGLPLLTVPESTPFHRVARTVAAALQRRHTEQLLALAEAQAAITGAALHRNAPVPAVLEATARAVGGWAALLDADGRTLATTSEAPEPGDTVRELAVRLARGDGPRSAVDHTEAGRVALHPVEAAGAAVRVLLLGGARPAPAAGRGAVAVAVGLLGLLSRGERSVDQQGGLAALLLLGDDPAESGRARELLGELLAGTEPEAGGSSSGNGGSAGEEPTRARVLHAGRPPGATADARPPGPLVDVRADTLRGVVPAAMGRPELDRLRERGDWLAVLSRPVLPGQLPAADREAGLLLRQAAESGTPLVAGEDGLGIAGALDPALAGEWARRTLAPLLDDPEGRGGAELAEVLRVWLACHGGWDRTAQLTGLHRNSVRHRVRRAEQLLGADLSDATARAELLLALRWWPGPSHS